MMRGWIRAPQPGRTRCYQIDVFNEEQFLPDTWILCINDQGEQVALEREESWPSSIQQRGVSKFGT